MANMYRGGCGCCNHRAIIYHMKEGLLDIHKKLDPPSGVDEGIWSRYLKQARDSGGFDLDEEIIPKDTDYATLTVVKFERDEADVTYEKLCIIWSKAVEWMVENNVKEGEEGLELVDVVKANELKGGAGILYSYFITFKAKKKNCCSGEMKEFQAEVECRPKIQADDLFTDRLPPKVKFCRMKPT